MTSPPGSTFGTARLLSDGKKLAEYTCSPPAPCDSTFVKSFRKPRLVTAGTLLEYDFTCAGNPSTEADECAAPDAFKATIEIGYELAVASVP